MEAGAGSCQQIISQIIKVEGFVLSQFAMFYFSTVVSIIYLRLNNAPT